MHLFLQMLVSLLITCGEVLSSKGDGCCCNGGLDYEGEGLLCWCLDKLSLGSCDSNSTGEAETDFYIGTDINGFDVGFIKYEYSEGAGDF